MNSAELFGKIQQLLNDIRAGGQAQTCEYLAAILQGTVKLPGVTELAGKLLSLDGTGPLAEEELEFLRDLYEDGIHAGDPDAMNNLGTLYYEGSRGFEQNYRKAAFYYGMGADSGSRKARENLGYCYYYGRTGEPDYEKAYLCFAPGAMEGLPVSLYKAGDMYRNGYYVKQSAEEAFRLYNRALEMLTDETAPEAAGPVYLRLGKVFLAGEGVQENAKTALICFQKAELFLFDMVSSGNTLYRESLREAVKGQADARRKLKTSEL